MIEIISTWRAAILIFISLSLFCISCKKEELVPSKIPKTEPVYTEIGANTMSYKVNGKLVVLDDENDNNTRVYGFLSNNIGPRLLDIHGEFIKPNHYEVVDMYVQNFKDTGYYTTYTNVPYKDISQFMYTIGPNDIITDGYTTDAIHHGYVHVTKLDTLNQIISGRFEFTAFLFFWGQEKDTVRISDGLFDFRYSKF